MDERTEGHFLRLASFIWLLPDVSLCNDLLKKQAHVVWKKTFCFLLPFLWWGSNSTEIKMLPSGALDLEVLTSEGTEKKMKRATTDINVL